MLSKHNFSLLDEFIDIYRSYVLVRVLSNSIANKQDQ